MLLRLHPRQRAFFFVLRLTSTLYPLEALRCKTCHTRHTPRLLPCLYYKPFLYSTPLSSFRIYGRTPDNDDCGIAPSVFYRVFAASLFFALCPLLSAFAGALPITMTAALLHPSFAIPLLRAFSLFFTLLQLFILWRHSAARPVIHAALPVFCHVCVCKYFVLCVRSACFPPRGDDIAPTVCPYLIAALNGSSQQCFRYRHARRAFAPFMRRLPLI